MKIANFFGAFAVQSAALISPPLATTKIGGRLSPFFLAGVKPPPKAWSQYVTVLGGAALIEYHVTAIQLLWAANTFILVASYSRRTAQAT